MREQTRSLLLQISTATITTQLLKRGIRACYLAGVSRLHANTPRIAGPAYTLRYIPYREDRDPLDSLGSAQNPARIAIEQCPAGEILVVDARGLASCGTLGDILALRLRERGVAGFVSDGGVRDVEAVTDVGLPIFCAGPAAPASANAHLPIETQTPIACGGVAVFPGDVMIADADGVVVIPRDLADEVADDAAQQESIEEYIVLLVAKGRPVIGTYPPNDEVREAHARWVAEGKPRD